MQSGVEYKLLKNNGPSHAQRVYALEANAASGILFSGGGGMDIFSDIWVFDMAAKEWIEVSTRA